MISKQTFHLTLLALIAVIGSGEQVAAQEKVVTPVPVIGAEHADDAPLAFPPLEHYAKLWQNSMFTTKSLPPPDDAPKGPVFTDSLTLAGTYEVDGAMVGVLMDKTTSQFMEVRIGAENEQGIKIVRVNQGATPDKTRLQLMKGQEAGWVTFSTEAAPSPDQSPQQGTPAGPGTAAPGRPGASTIPGRPVVPQPNTQPQQIPGAPGLRSIPAGGPGGGGPMGGPAGGPAMRSQSVAPPPQQPVQQSPVVPVIPNAAPPSDGDIPLPPQ